jgi:hypothetical protein
MLINISISVGLDSAGQVAGSKREISVHSPISHAICPGRGDFLIDQVRKPSKVYLVGVF